MPKPGKLHSSKEVSVPLHCTLFIHTSEDPRIDLQWLQHFNFKYSKGSYITFHNTETKILCLKHSFGYINYCMHCCSTLSNTIAMVSPPTFPPAGRSHNPVDDTQHWHHLCPKMCCRHAPRYLHRTPPQSHVSQQHSHCHRLVSL